MPRNSGPPRVKRGAGPDGKIRGHNYRERALPSLLRDFQERCAYSMQHLLTAGGEHCMEVDHFDPRKKNDSVQEYANLYLASRHCNGLKRDTWPSPDEHRLGIRFLDCCKELDYGKHLFEDPLTHKIVGTTPAGRYHCRVLGLNDRHLVEERRHRTEIAAALAALPPILPNEPERQVAAGLRRHLALLIPPIPPPPARPPVAAAKPKPV